MIAYLAGLATLPALALTAAASIRAAVWIRERHGISVEFKTDRNPETISDYTLRHDIWHEAQRGPVFTGHWCRYNHAVGGDVVTRWIGVGKADGRSVMLYRRRDL